VLNGIFWVLRSGAPWRDLPERFGPRTTCYNRFARWRKAGMWDRLMDAITAAHDGDIQMIDSTSVRTHQQSATAKRGSADHCLGRSRGGLTTSKLKHFRGVATRYDKVATNLLAMVQLASIRLWLRAYESTA